MSKRKRDDPTSVKEFESLDHNKLAKSAYSLMMAKKSGWWNYYQLEHAFDDVVRRHREEIKKLKDELAKFTSENDLKLPDHIIKLVTENKETFECPCCKDDLFVKERDKYTITACGHFFCKQCLNDWTIGQKKDTCPSCRKKICRTNK